MDRCVLSTSLTDLYFTHELSLYMYGLYPFLLTCIIFNRKYGHSIHAICMYALPYTTNIKALSIHIILVKLDIYILDISSMDQYFQTQPLSMLHTIKG